MLDYKATTPSSKVGGKEPEAPRHRLGQTTEEMRQTKRTVLTGAEPTDAAETGERHHALRNSPTPPREARVPDNAGGWYGRTTPRGKKIDRPYRGV